MIIKLCKLYLQNSNFYKNLFFIFICADFCLQKKKVNMNINTVNLNTECNRKTDRRQNNMPVEFDRRSGTDRRNNFETLIQQNVNDKLDTFAYFRQQQPICVSPISIIQPIDKVEDIQDCIKEKNYFKAFGVGLFLINSFGKDVLELKSFRDGFINIIKNRKFVREDCEIPHSFASGTEIIKIEHFEILRKIDKTLFDLTFGKLILKKLGMTKRDKLHTGLFYKNGKPIYKFKIIGNKYVEIIGRAFLRTPVLGIAILSLLEAPSIFNKKKHRKEQIIKSTISVASITAGGAILGAIGAYYPPFGFIGAGLGSYLGYKFSDYINKKVNESF